MRKTVTAGGSQDVVASVGRSPVALVSARRAALQYRAHSTEVLELEMDDTALEFMAHTLQVFTQVELSEQERTAAFTLLRALPQDTLIKDLVKAASPEEVARRGLPAEIAETLKPLLSRLELSLPYAGRFASLLEPPERVD